MVKTQLAVIISRALFFQGMAPELIEKLASIASIKHYKAGETIFADGDRGDGFHLVNEGRIKIFKSSADGKEQILHIFGPGEPFGEVAVFLDRPYPASSVALEDTDTVFFPRAALRELIRENPDLAFGMMAVMARRLVRFTGLLEAITLKEVPSRLAAFILDSEAYESGRVELSVSKGQLASLLGTTPETISRAFGRLKSLGLISEKKPYILITDRLKLAEVADTGISEL